MEETAIHKSIQTDKFVSTKAVVNFATCNIILKIRDLEKKIKELLGPIIGLLH